MVKQRPEAIGRAVAKSSAGDFALSRRKQGFESPRERQQNQAISLSAARHCPVSVPSDELGAGQKNGSGLAVSEAMRSSVIFVPHDRSDIYIGNPSSPALAWNATVSARPRSCRSCGGMSAG